MAEKPQESGTKGETESRGAIQPPGGAGTDYYSFVKSPGPVGAYEVSYDNFRRVPITLPGFVSQDSPTSPEAMAVRQEIDETLERLGIGIEREMVKMDAILDRLRKTRIAA